MSMHSAGSYFHRYTYVGLVARKLLFLSQTHQMASLRNNKFHFQYCSQMVSLRVWGWRSNSQWSFHWCSVLKSRTSQGDACCKMGLAIKDTIHCNLKNSSGVIWLLINDARNECWFLCNWRLPYHCSLAPSLVGCESRYNWFVCMQNIYVLLWRASNIHSIRTSQRYNLFSAESRKSCSIIGPCICFWVTKQIYIDNLCLLLQEALPLYIIELFTSLNLGSRQWTDVTFKLNNFGSTL